MMLLPCQRNTENAIWYCRCGTRNIVSLTEREDICSQEQRHCRKVYFWVISSDSMGVPLHAELEGFCKIFQRGFKTPKHCVDDPRNPQVDKKESRWLQVGLGSGPHNALAYSVLITNNSLSAAQSHRNRMVFAHTVSPEQIGCFWRQIKTSNEDAHIFGTQSYWKQRGRLLSKYAQDQAVCPHSAYLSPNSLAETLQVKLTRL